MATEPVVTTPAAAALPVPQPPVDTAGIVKSERERVAGLMAVAARHPGFEALVTAHVADGKTAGDLAIAILDAHAAQEKGGRAIAAMAAELPQAPAPLAPAATVAAEAELAALPIDERCKRKWETSAAVREDFLSLPGYIAYEKAFAEGRVHMLTKPKAAA